LVCVGKGAQGTNDFPLQYGDFKHENGIGTPEDYLALAGAGGDATRVEPFVKLADSVFAWTLEKLKHLLAHDVIGAMKAFSGKEGPEKYIAAMIDRMFELAAPLWSFDRSQLNNLQALRYDQVTNVGVPDSEVAKTELDGFVQEARHHYGIRAQYNYTSTGDPYRISTLAYAAALPACFLADLKEMKQEYEEGMSPTYHIDPVLEREVPDLFPVDERANKTLRVLALAIVPGIDVVHDEYHPGGKRGHRFTLDSPAVRDYTSGDPLRWTLFRDMYKAVQGTGNDRLDQLETIIGLLRERIPQIPKNDLRQLVDTQIKRFQKRVGSRDFSRLVSARLTYREMKELERFVDPRRYALDLGRYIEGQS
jgi:hypothetical protein